MTSTTDTNAKTQLKIEFHSSIRIQLEVGNCVEQRSCLYLCLLDGRLFRDLSRCCT